MAVAPTTQLKSSNPNPAAQGQGGVYPPPAPTYRYVTVQANNVPYDAFASQYPNLTVQYVDSIQDRSNSALVWNVPDQKLADGTSWVAG